MERIPSVSGVIELYGESDDNLDEAAAYLACAHDGPVAWVAMSGPHPATLPESCLVLRPALSEAGVEAAVTLLKRRRALVVLDRATAMQPYAYRKSLEVDDFYETSRKFLAHALIQWRLACEAYGSTLVLLNELRADPKSGALKTFHGDVIAPAVAGRIRCGSGPTERRYGAPWRYVLKLAWSIRGVLGKSSVEAFYGQRHSRGWQYVRSLLRGKEARTAGARYKIGGISLGPGKELACEQAAEHEETIINAYLRSGREGDSEDLEDRRSVPRRDRGRGERMRRRGAEVHGVFGWQRGGGDGRDGEA